MVVTDPMKAVEMTPCDSNMIGGLHEISGKRSVKLLAEVWYLVRRGSEEARGIEDADRSDETRDPPTETLPVGA